MRQRIESLEQFRALQAEYMAARDAENVRSLSAAARAVSPAAT